MSLLFKSQIAQSCQPVLVRMRVHPMDAKTFLTWFRRPAIRLPAHFAYIHGLFPAVIVMESMDWYRRTGRPDSRTLFPTGWHTLFLWSTFALTPWFILAVPLLMDWACIQCASNGIIDMLAHVYTRWFVCVNSALTKIWHLICRADSLSPHNSHNFKRSIYGCYVQYKRVIRRISSK